MQNYVSNVIRYQLNLLNRIDCRRNRKMNALRGILAVDLVPVLADVEDEMRREERRGGRESVTERKARTQREKIWR